MYRVGLDDPASCTASGDPWNEDMAGRTNAVATAGPPRFTSSSPTGTA